MEIGVHGTIEIMLENVWDEAQRLREHREFGQHQKSWFNALQALSSSFDRLGAAFEGDPASRAWFANVREEVLTSPLMSYLYAARNVEQHTLGSTIRHVSPQFKLPMGKALKWTRTMGTELSGGGGVRAVTSRVEFSAEDGDLSPFEITNETVDVIPFDYKKKRYDPPLIHRGKCLPDLHAFTALEAAVMTMREYLEQSTVFVNQRVREQDEARRRADENSV